MGDGFLQPVIQTVTIDIMLNNNGLNIGDGLNFVTCEQTCSETDDLLVVKGIKCLTFSLRAQILYAMWQFRELHPVYKEKGWKEQHFVTRTMAAR